MIIHELNIEAFGGVTDRRLTLSDGANLIIGGNESGKSTAAAFIRYLFYGFARGEKELLSDYKGGRSHGSAVFSLDNGERFIITRTTARTGRGTVKVTRGDGTPFDEWRESGKEPGDHFLRIPEALFSRSVFVSQRSGSALPGDSADAIRNILSTGDDTLDLQKALKRLDECRTELQHKKGIGGKLPLLDQRIASLKEELSNSTATRLAAEQLNAALSEAELSLSEKDAEIAAAEAELCSLKHGKIKKLLSDRSASEKAISRLAAEKNVLRRQNTFNGFIPDTDYSEALRAAAENLREARHSAELLSVKLQAASPSAPLNTEIQTEPRAKKAVERRKLTVTTACLALLSVFAAVLSAVLFSQQPYFLPLLITFIALFVTATAAALILYLTDTKNRQSYDDSQDTYFRNASSAAETDDGKSKQLQAEYQAASANAARLEEELRALLAKWGKSSPESAQEAFSSFTNAENAINAEQKAAESELRLINTELSHYSEQEISAAAAAEEIDENKPSGTGSVTEAVILTLKSERAALSQKVNELRLSYASKYSTLPDSARLTAELSELSEERELLLERLEAINLAASALNAVGNEQRKSVSPLLAEKAGALFSRITDGKYTAINLAAYDKSCELSYLADGSFISADYFSAGSADLAWLCLRLAIHQTLSERERLPLILDECFVRFDDVRLKRILTLIESTDTQSIMFSASLREKALVSSKTAVTLLSSPE